jgi:hypothetical protein
LLKPDRARGPRPRLADRETPVVEGDDGLERRLPAGEVFARQKAAFRGREAVDRLSDEAFVESLSRSLDLLLPRPTAALEPGQPASSGSFSSIVAVIRG